MLSEMPVAGANDVAGSSGNNNCKVDKAPSWLARAGTRRHESRDETGESFGDWRLRVRTAECEGRLLSILYLLFEGMNHTLSHARTHLETRAHQVHTCFTPVQLR